MMTEPQPGENLDHYQIKTLIARGGMASIFRCIDMRTWGEVAIKVPHPDAESDPVFFSRFRREAEICKRLNHPSIVKVIADECPCRLYMVMEWAEGRSLRKILSEEGRLTPERAVRVALEICKALEYMHGERVVHRDLKPENIMIDGEDRIKLLDFGIASHAGARRLTFSKLSHTMGTPDYISPELVQRKRGDARSDIYALGVILYEMLTGELPFRGPNPLVIMNDRLLNHPIPPREANPAISRELQEILYRALERDPKNRYRSAREFAWDLEHQDQVGVPERPELRDWKRRRPAGTPRALSYVVLAMIPVVVLVLLLFVAHKR